MPLLWISSPLAAKWKLSARLLLCSMPLALSFRRWRRGGRLGDGVGLGHGGRGGLRLGISVKQEAYGLKRILLGRRYGLGHR